MPIEGIRVRSQHGALVCVVALDDLEKTEALPISFMTWKSKASKRTILSTFGAEASAYTREMLCEVVIGRRVFPDEWTEEHLSFRVITDCKSLFDCLDKDASVPEDRGTALTVASLRERCFSRSVKRHEKIGFDVGADRSVVGGRTDKIIGWSLLEKRSEFGNRSGPRREHESHEEETNHQQVERGSGRLNGANGSRAGT